MADKTKVDYDALADAGSKFSQEADRIRNIAGRLGQGTENLKRSGWVGKGADAYYKEWESNLLPTYRRLSDALREAAKIFKELSKLFNDAETEGSNLLKGTGGGSPGDNVLGSAASAVDQVAAALGAIARGMGGGGLGQAGGGGLGAAGAAAMEAGGIGAASAAFSDAIRRALGLGGAGGDSSGGSGGAGGAEGDLESFPSTLEGILKDALGGAGLKPSGNIIEIVLQKGKGMADTGQQYGTDQSGAGGGGGEPSGAGGGAPPTETPAETPSGGGGSGGGSDSGFGGGGSGGGVSMVQGGAVGTPLAGGQGFWFGATPGTRLSSPQAALGGAMPVGHPAGGDALGLLASFGATAGAAVLGIVGKSIAGKGLK
jgi:WXG100 family type VII secretion target